MNDHVLFLIHRMSGRDLRKTLEDALGMAPMTYRVSPCPGLDSIPIPDWKADDKRTALILRLPSKTNPQLCKMYTKYIENTNNRWKKGQNHHWFEDFVSQHRALVLENFNFSSWPLNHITLYTSALYTSPSPMELIDTFILNDGEMPNIHEKRTFWQCNGLGSIISCTEGWTRTTPGRASYIRREFGTIVAYSRMI